MKFRVFPSTQSICEESVQALDVIIHGQSCKTAVENDVPHRVRVQRRAVHLAHHVAPDRPVAVVDLLQIGVQRLRREDPGVEVLHGTLRLPFVDGPDQERTAQPEQAGVQRNPLQSRPEPTLRIQHECLGKAILTSATSSHEGSNWVSKLAEFYALPVPFGGLLAGGALEHAGTVCSTGGRR